MSRFFDAPEATTLAGMTIGTVATKARDVRTRRALLLYDELETPSSYSDGLNAAGFEMLFATDVDSAVVTAATQCPDVIVIDIRHRPEDCSLFLKRAFHDVRLQ